MLSFSFNVFKVFKDKSHQVSYTFSCFVCRLFRLAIKAQMHIGPMNIDREKDLEHLNKYSFHHALELNSFLLSHLLCLFYHYLKDNASLSTHSINYLVYFSINLYL